jgi:hypothetical protein
LVVDDGYTTIFNVSSEPQELPKPEYVPTEEEQETINWIESLNGFVQDGYGYMTYPAYVLNWVTDFDEMEQIALHSEKCDWDVLVERYEKTFGLSLKDMLLDGKYNSKDEFISMLQEQVFVEYMNMISCGGRTYIGIWIYGDNDMMLEYNGLPVRCKYNMLLSGYNNVFEGHWVYLNAVTEHSVFFDTMDELEYAVNNMKTFDWEVFLIDFADKHNWTIDYLIDYICGKDGTMEWLIACAQDMALYTFESFHEYGNFYILCDDWGGHMSKECILTEVNGCTVYMYNDNENLVPVSELLNK